MTEYIVNAEEERLFYGDKYEELVRCKDCAWWAINNTGICLNHLMDTEENDFCSWAKMKGGAE